MSNTFPPTIPVVLANLFEDSDFIASAPDSTKPCFKGKFFTDNNFSGWAYRRIYGENYSDTTRRIQQVCEGMSQSLNQYKGTHFHDLIMNKMIKLRFGIMNIRRAYDGNYKALSGIDTSLLIIDLTIPDQIKASYGFCSSESKESELES